VGRTDLSNRPSTRSFTCSWARHAEHPLTSPSVRLAKAQYHSSQVARDRDRLRDQVLVNLGWTLHHIWGTAWYRNRVIEEGRLRSAIESAVLAPVRGLLGGDHSRTPAVAPPVELAAAEFETEPAWTAPYVTAAVSRLPAWVDVSDSSNIYLMRDPIVEIVRVEGPVHIGVVRERLRAAWNKGRIGSRIQGNIDAAIRTTDLTVDGSFIRSPASVTLAVRTPTDECRRGVEQVHDDELALALVNLVRDSGGVALGELTSAVARIFGWNRRGSDIAQRLHRQVQLLLDRELLRRVGDELSAAAID
jgi:hypothetical protein